MLPLGMPSVRHLVHPIHSTQLFPPDSMVMGVALPSWDPLRRSSFLYCPCAGEALLVSRRRLDIDLKYAGFETWFFHLGQLTYHP